ncbi:MAG: formylglycine-generating enzyme family protein [Magnetococcales bacterium]|nr:formylglycine-generating enzyme family protein [Magnetococcales bacterium]
MTFPRGGGGGVGREKAVPTVGGAVGAGAEEPPMAPVPLKELLAAFPEPAPRKKGTVLASLNDHHGEGGKPEPLPNPTPLRIGGGKEQADLPPTTLQPEPSGAPVVMAGGGEKRGVNGNEKVDVKSGGEDPRIAVLLKEGGRHFQAMRLTLPEGENALESYRAVLTIDPGRGEAREGIRNIASRLLELARQDLEEEHLTQPEEKNAISRVMLAAKLDPNNEGIRSLSDQIVEKLVQFAKGAAHKHQRRKVETWLGQAFAIAPENRVLVQAYKELLNKDIGLLQNQIQAVAGASSTSAIEPKVEVREENRVGDKAITPAEVHGATEKGDRITHPTTASGVWKDPVTGMEFVEISEGCFHMGSEEGDMDESPRHRVCLDRYRISKTEVTQGVWKKMMGSDNNPSKFNKDDTLPVDSVSWVMAVEFIRRLNEKASTTVFRLPSEAEWENACRAGGGDPYQTGMTITSSQANFNGTQPLPGEEKGEFRRSTMAVGSFAPNRFGLYDMHGNVYEWVEDWYVKDYYAKSSEHNPVAKDDSSSLHGLRGGAWHSSASNVRCGYRYRGRPDANNSGNGVRLVHSAAGG